MRRVWVVEAYDDGARRWIIPGWVAIGDLFHRTRSDARTAQYERRGFVHSRTRVVEYAPRGKRP